MLVCSCCWHHADATASGTARSETLPAETVDLVRALRTAVAASTRHALEQFCDEFKRDHTSISHFRRACGMDLSGSSTTSVLKHFEQCGAVTADEKLLLGDKRSATLASLGIKLPTGGSLAGAYRRLSAIIHSEAVRGTRELSACHWCCPACVESTSLC